MGLPSGVSTATVTFGTDADVLGVGATTTLTITPSHTLIWAATGEIIRAFSVSVDAAAGVVGSFAIPHTDQAGFTDELGNAITNWYYTVAGLVARSGETQPYRKVFQVASGVTSLNLDLIPVNGTVGAVGIAPQPVVLAVNGRTGAVVTAEVGGDGKLLESQVPDRLSDANLSLTYGAVFADTAITYDGSGNVSSVTENGITTTYTYNGDGTVATDTRLGVTREYTYDGSGNLTGIEAV